MLIINDKKKGNFSNKKVNTIDSEKIINNNKVLAFKSLKKTLIRYIDKIEMSVISKKINISLSNI